MGEKFAIRHSQPSAVLLYLQRKEDGDDNW